MYILYIQLSKYFNPNLFSFLLGFSFMQMMISSHKNFLSCSFFISWKTIHETSPAPLCVLPHQPVKHDHNVPSLEPAKTSLSCGIHSGAYIQKLCGTIQQTCKQFPLSNTLRTSKGYHFFSDGLGFAHKTSAFILVSSESEGMENTEVLWYVWNMKDAFCVASLMFHERKLKEYKCNIIKTLC